MALQDGCFLLVDSNWDFSLELVEHIKATQPSAASKIIIAGDNTKQMLKMMFNEQIKDYCYCDFDNEISVSELATYLHQHHNICAVLFYSLDYHLASSEQRFIFDSLHRFRYIIEQSPAGFEVSQLNTKVSINHLSCHPERNDLPTAAHMLSELNRLLGVKSKVVS